MKPSVSLFTARVYGIVGLLIALLLWAFISYSSNGFLAQQLRPLASFQQLFYLLQSADFYWHIALSLKRIAIGLGGAFLLGLPLGLFLGGSLIFRQTFTPICQFLRMISPLSWMPIAVMAFGIGDKAIYFLLIMAAVWPIALNTAHGAQQLNPQWRLLSQSLSATRTEFVLHILLPAIRKDVVTGLRLALGVVWIVLVPCEMLGVNAGLGYFILDTRDRMAYSELMATLMVIGVIGYALDSFCQSLGAIRLKLPKTQFA